MDNFADIIDKISKKEILGIEDIYRLIPQREPFLMVDKVLDVDIEKKYIKAEKDVKESEYYFKGHFPNEPIMPGVLIIESLAQTASILGRILEQKDGIYVFAEIEKAKFLQVVKPNSTLIFDVQLIKVNK